MRGWFYKLTEDARERIEKNILPKFSDEQKKRLKEIAEELQTSLGRAEK